MDMFQTVLHVAVDPQYSKWICPTLLLADAGLTGLIIWKIPCKRLSLLGMVTVTC